MLIFNVFHVDVAVCPQLSTITADTVFLTVENMAELVPSTDERTPGTTVTVKCNSGYTLTGESTFTCRAGGTWSYTTKPTCIRKSKIEIYFNSIKHNHHAQYFFCALNICYHFVFLPFTASQYCFGKVFPV